MLHDTFPEVCGWSGSRRLLDNLALVPRRLTSSATSTWPSATTASLFCVEWAESPTMRAGCSLSSSVPVLRLLYFAVVSGPSLAKPQQTVGGGVQETGHLRRCGGDACTRGLLYGRPRCGYGPCQSRDAYLACGRVDPVLCALVLPPYVTWWLWYLRIRSWNSHMGRISGNQVVAKLQCCFGRWHCGGRCGCCWLHNLGASGNVIHSHREVSQRV